MTSLSTFTDKDGKTHTYDAAMDNATALFQVSVAILLCSHITDRLNCNKLNQSKPYASWNCAGSFGWIINAQFLNITVFYSFNACRMLCCSLCLMNMQRTFLVEGLP